MDNVKSLLRSFGWSLALTVAAFGYVLFGLGASALLVTAILAAIELSFSFDNAVINAKVLTQLSPLWRTLFLTVGIVVAIFGVRAFLPILIVGLTAHLPLGAVTDLAFHHPNVYADKLVAARPAITAFGGAFLLMLSLNFFLAERETKWLKVIERPLSKLEYWWLPFVIGLVVLGGLSFWPGNQHRSVELLAGLAGLVTYSAINGLVTVLNKLFASDTDATTQRVGWAAFATFVYLEILDASLSFDGVIGAFAITNSVVLIALGLGIGAIWVRSLTVYMVKHRTLDSYKYLEHGAHYAITVLAATMLLGVIVEVPDILTGVLCLGLLGSAALTSREAAEELA